MSIANDINIAKVCQVLATRDIERGKEKDRMYPRKLYIARKAVEWLNTNNSADTTLKGKWGYMVAMCGKYVSEAKGILSLGATGVNVSAVYGNGSVLMPYPINITISSGGVYTVTNLAWVGLTQVNTVVINGVNYQSGVGFSFNSATGTFDFTLGSYLLQVGDVMTALGFKVVSSGIISGGTTSVLPTTVYVSASYGLTLSVPITVSHTVLLFLRGGSPSGGVITSGSPTGAQVLFDNTTGLFTVAAGNEFAAGETITIQYY